jgi:hypothetical protein
MVSRQPVPGRWQGGVRDEKSLLRRDLRRGVDKLQGGSCLGKKKKKRPSMYMYMRSWLRQVH